jgi:hypothetical protein
MHKYVGPVEGRTYIASKFLLSTRQALCFLRLTLVTHAHVLGVRVYPYILEAHVKPHMPRLAQKKTVCSADTATTFHPKQLHSDTT